MCQFNNNNWLNKNKQQQMQSCQGMNTKWRTIEWMDLINLVKWLNEVLIYYIGWSLLNLLKIYYSESESE